MRRRAFLENAAAAAVLPPARRPNILLLFPDPLRCSATPVLFDLKDDPQENTNIAAKAPGEGDRLSRLVG